MSGPTKSQGDPRVLLVMNLVLSALFAWVVVSALSFAGQLAFDWATVTGLALLTAAATYFVTR